MLNFDSVTISPIHYRVIERRGNGWAFKECQPFINWYNVPLLSQEDLFTTFGTSMKRIAIELFRINGGKEGYYIANIKDKKYYYCGAQWEDVKATLLELGIGRNDPMSF